MCNQDLRRYQGMGFDINMAAVMMVLGFATGVRLLKGSPKAKTVKAGKELYGDVYGTLSDPLNPDNLMAMCRTSELADIEAL